ncbi:MAG TPA: cell division protein FtsQ/DivIB, partial [Gammaproteobacteria bacterium]|nr:cell division protein FtsQ/DivIB [Gammaproteobacteria bacterium]
MNVRITKLVFKLLFLSVFLILGVQIYQTVHSSKSFPIKLVHIYNAPHVDHTELQQLLTPLLAHNFFAVDMEQVQDRLLQFSWVENVAIRRAWPDTIDIYVTEHQPIARWRDGSLLSASGNLFNPGSYKEAADLPQFVGADGEQETMLQYFNDLNRELSVLHAKITRLELAPYELWQLTLDNGIRLRLGHKNILTQLSQFVKVYPKIIGD